MPGLGQQAHDFDRNFALDLDDVALLHHPELQFVVSATNANGSCQGRSSRTETVRVINEDANAALLKWCSEMDTKRERAVVFFDSFGASVEWKVIKGNSSHRGSGLVDSISVRRDKPDARE
jgi:hypothetical protein